MNIKPKGKNTFSTIEAADIKRALKECRQVGRDAQKSIRENELRRRLKFHIRDFSDKNGFTPEDFDQLVADGAIKIVN